MKIAILPTILFLAASFAGTASAAAPAHWVVAWGASPAPQLPDETQMRTAKLLFDNQTIREIVHTSIGERYGARAVVERLRQTGGRDRRGSHRVARQGFEDRRRLRSRGHV